jgi:hypothetical protein
MSINSENDDTADRRKCLRLIGVAGAAAGTLPLSRVSATEKAPLGPTARNDPLLNGVSADVRGISKL